MNEVALGKRPQLKYGVENIEINDNKASAVQKQLREPNRLAAHFLPHLLLPPLHTKTKYFQKPAQQCVAYTNAATH